MQDCEGLSIPQKVQLGVPLSASDWQKMQGKLMNKDLDERLLDAKISGGVNDALVQQILDNAKQRIEDDMEDPGNKRVIGADLGRDIDRRLPRNKPCLCGSNIKAKKCCVTLGKALEKLQELQEQEGDDDV